MRKIIANAFVTLDGVMQAPGGPEEDPTGGFKYGGWIVNYWDEMMAKVIMEMLAEPFDLLLGRKTRDIFAAYWPYLKNDPDKLTAMIANKWSSARKFIVSKLLTKADRENSALIQGDAVKEITELKKQNGPEIQVHRSSNLIPTLLKNDLIDDFRVWTFPLAIGTRKCLFGEGTIPAGLKLLECKISTTGVSIATYARSGEIKTCSLAFENPRGAIPPPKTT